MYEIISCLEWHFYNYYLSAVKIKHRGHKTRVTTAINNL